MQFARAMAAVVFYNNDFYTFGGYAGTNLSSCEKFSFASGKWETLPNMPVLRSAFNVAVVDGVFYMSGDSTKLDSFNPETKTFTTTEISIPEANYSNLAVFNGNLVLFQNDGCWGINLQTKVSHKLAAIPMGKWWSCFPPYTYKNNILIARCDDVCLWAFDTSSYSIVKKYKLVT